MLVYNDAPTGDDDQIDHFADVLLVTRDEAARVLRISVRNLDTLTAEGKLQATRIGRRVLYRREELSRFAREGAPPRS